MTLESKAGWYQYSNLEHGLVSLQLVNFQSPITRRLVVDRLKPTLLIGFHEDTPSF